MGMDTFPCFVRQIQDTDSRHPSRQLTWRMRHGFRRASLGLKTKHGRMVRLKYLTVAEVHVHAARQAGIKTANRAHAVDTLELVGAILLKDRCALNRIF